MHALDKEVTKYEGRYSAGFTPVREARFERMKELGLIKADCA